jgi:CheY-like chemotaxis protein
VGYERGRIRPSRFPLRILRPTGQAAFSRPWDEMPARFADHHNYGIAGCEMGSSQVPPASERAREVVLSTKTLIAIVDDDQGFRDALTSLIRSLGYRVRGFSSAPAFLASPNIRNTSCLIADVQMPAMTGVDLYSRLVESGHAIPTIIVTAYPDDGVRVRALTGGVICYLSKPVDVDELLACIRAALGGANPGEET